MTRSREDRQRKAHPRQLPLELKHQAGFSSDDLIEADCNRQAVEQINRWPDWSVPVTILAGPTGSGKSHLAEIWLQRANGVCLDLSAPGATDFDPVTQKPVLIDDIGLVPFDENSLFHLINTVQEAGSFLLMTSRIFPVGWPVKLPDLASRLKAATIVEIREPDDQLLHGVMTKLFADRQIAVEPQVISYIVHRIERSVATAMKTVEALDNAALEHQRRITRSLAATVIGKLDQGPSANNV